MKSGIHLILGVAHLMTWLVLGAAEGMMRDRLVTAQQHQPTPFREAHIRAVFSALVSSLGPD
jgi:hypothetical protein